MEVKALLEKYKQFDRLVENKSRGGSSSPGEDGRSVESLVRSCLRKFLPHSLEVASGFILRPAVKTGENGEERRGQRDTPSSQLDILVFDRAHYPTIGTFGDTFVVPPEGVVGIISVKKTLRFNDVSKECESLLKAARLCRTLDHNNNPRRGPYLGIIGMDTERREKTETVRNNISSKISSAYQRRKPYFDEVVGYVGVIGKYGAFKKRPKKTADKAEFIWFDYEENEKHLALQFLITGILSVYYDSDRSRLRRPGFTGFPSGRQSDDFLGCVPVEGLRSK